MQRRTAGWLTRAFPLGLRLSGANMSPLPCWLAGAQFVALNFSNNDLAVQLHFALFKGSKGYILKPPEMRPAMDEDYSAEEAAFAAACEMSTGPSERGSGDVASSRGSTRRSSLADNDLYWPPPRERLARTTIEIFSLHNLPKRTEQRPRYSGSHSACHDYHPELSGKAAPPDNRDPSSPELSLSLHPIGGFCALSTILPLEMSGETEVKTRCVLGNGMNAAFVQEVHCVAAEPDATFLRASVTDGGLEVAYETAVLGRLRCGYRVLHLRGLLGTRIELAFLFVRVRSGLEPNMWQTPRQLRIQSLKAEAANKSGKSGEAAADKEKLHQDQVARLRAEVARLKQKLASRGEEAGEGED